MRIGERLKELGLELPEVSLPQGNYTNCVHPEIYCLYQVKVLPVIRHLPVVCFREKLVQITQRSKVNNLQRDRFKIFIGNKAELGTLGWVRRSEVTRIINATPDFSASSSDGWMSI